MTCISQAGRKSGFMATTVADINRAQSVAFSSYQDELQELNKVIVRRLASFKRIALRVLGNAADAEDAVQDVFFPTASDCGKSAEGSPFC